MPNKTIYIYLFIFIYVSQKTINLYLKFSYVLLNIEPPDPTKKQIRIRLDRTTVLIQRYFESESGCADYNLGSEYNPFEGTGPGIKTLIQSIHTILL